MHQGDDLMIRLEIAPANNRGDLAVWAEIADDHDRRCRLRAGFLTNYPDLDAFHLSIARLINGEVEEAVLSGQ